jgi:hypothetical protein
MNSSKAASVVMFAHLYEKFVFKEEIGIQYLRHLKGESQ